MAQIQCVFVRRLENNASMQIEQRELYVLEPSGVVDFYADLS